MVEFMERPSGRTKRAPVALGSQERVRNSPRAMLWNPVAIRSQGTTAEPDRVADPGPRGPELGSPLGPRHPTLTAVGMGSRRSGGRLIPHQQGAPGTVRLGAVSQPLGRVPFPQLLWDLVWGRSVVSKPPPDPVNLGRFQWSRCPTARASQPSRIHMVRMLTNCRLECGTTTSSRLWMLVLQR